MDVEITAHDVANPRAVGTSWLCVNHCSCTRARTRFAAPVTISGKKYANTSGQVAAGGRDLSPSLALDHG
ncbi:MAG: hypothetical protein WCF36_04975 [Candidatus Nanopelagicales bacterium]